MANLTEDEMKLLRRALDEAYDALSALKRMHGHEVAELCYPAVNTVGEALRTLASHDVLQARA